MNTLIKNKKLIGQPIDYVDIVNDPYAPTDIDGVIEWKDVGWIFLECKHAGAPIPDGQNLMYERLIKDLSKDKIAICIVFDHNEDNPDIPIKARDCIIRQFYVKDKDGNFTWHTPTKQLFIKDYIPALIKRINTLTNRPENYGNFLLNLDIDKS